MPSERTGRIDRHGRKWRLQVKVHGERIRRSFDTREEAESALAAILADVERDAAADLARRLGRLTVADLVHLYYERRKPDLEASTCARYENVMEKYILPGFGHHDVRDVVATPMILEDWIGTVPWGSARKALEVIGPAFRMAHLNGLIDSNPVERIRRPKAANRKRKKEIPSPDEVEKIVIAAYEQGGVWWGYFVELTAVLGLRRAETCALRWEDFTFPASEDDPVGRIRVVRAVAKMDGGTYIKLPKGGIEREVLVDRSLYDGLGYFDGKEGWLFPGRDVLPRRDPTRLTPTSTAGRLVLWLDDRGGELSCSQGRAGAEARRAIGTNSATMSEVSRSLEAAGYIERDTNARRTFRLSLTARGRDAAAELADVEVTSKPVHPDTASHRFAELIDRLGLTGESGRPYTLHSLRHFRATYLYNVTKDWVQVARYLGHASPVITMDLYANNVVETTQLDLARAAVRLSDP